jgi:hypothetical protein
MRWKAFYSLCSAFIGLAYFIGMIIESKSIVFLIAMAAVFPLIILNQAILNWRRKRGRDIEEEEKYETEGGFTTLHVNTTKEELRSGKYGGFNSAAPHGSNANGAAGIARFTIAAILGRSRIDMTVSYAHAIEAAKRRAVTVLGEAQKKQGRQVSRCQS